MSLSKEEYELYNLTFDEFVKKMKQRDKRLGINRRIFMNLFNDALIEKITNNLKSLSIYLDKHGFSLPIPEERSEEKVLGIDFGTFGMAFKYANKYTEITLIFKKNAIDPIKHRATSIEKLKSLKNEIIYTLQKAIFLFEMAPKVLNGEISENSWKRMKINGKSK